MKVQNYGDGQEVTALVGVDDGLETDFAPYTTFIEKGQSKSIPFNVRPESAERTTYKINAVVKGKDETKRSATAWLTVDEMVADADKLGQDDFINEYDRNGATLEDWEELRSVTGGVTYTDDDLGGEEPPGIDYTLYIIIAVVAVVAAVLILFLYRKSSAQGGNGSPSWDDLGLK